jgi:beta-N-acetylhexosaminidase
MYLTREEIRHTAGQQIVCGFSGQQLDSELKELLRDIKPAGLILFSRNIASLEQVSELCREIKSYYGKPLALCIDQEGGRVARIKEPATVWPPMRKLGDIDDAELTFQVGKALGCEMRALGFDIDFAPVLDVDTNPQNPIIGDRAFSEAADNVAKHGTALFLGLEAGGVGACGKHFPGHGDTDKDSHLDLPYVKHDLKRLRDVEWKPFKEAIAKGLDAIMTAHVVVECIDASLPATFAPDVLKYLRDELQFKGIIFGDDLEMQAVADRFSNAQMAALGIKAGIDMYLVCKTPSIILEFYRALVQQYEQHIPSELHATSKRIAAWIKRHVRTSTTDWRSIVGCQQHIDLAASIGANP